MSVNIFDRYGIKEVANVYFEALETDTAAGVYKGDIVLYLDSLKVSTIETSAETTDATGGRGNAKLVSWDFGKEINLTLTDALMSLESLRLMLGGAIKRPKVDDSVIVHHTAEVVCGAGGIVPKPKINGVEKTPTALTNHPIRLINMTTGTRTQLVEGTIDGTKKIVFKNPSMISGTGNTQDTAADDHIRIFWDEIITSGDTAIEVTISPDTFPGAYKIIGDTLIRSEKTQKDEMFQFIINKAKVQSNVTLTMEAEGDPSTFELTLTVLRSTSEDGQNEMMKLIRYSVADQGGSTGDDNGSIPNG